MATVYVILAALVPVLAYEAYTLTQEGLWTISSGVRYLGQEWSLFAPYALSVLLGHFYVQPPTTLAERWSETTEVALVLWGGWAVYVIDKGVDPSLPWWGYVLLCTGGVLVGGFCWTLGT